MKKTITLWTFVMSLLFVSVFTDSSAQERQTAPKSTTNPDVKENQEKKARENSRLPQKVKLEQMTDEERIEYLRQRDQVNSRQVENPSELSVEKQRMLQMEKERMIQAEKEKKSATDNKMSDSKSNESAKYSITRSDYESLPAHKKAHIDENPNLYIIK